jgi:hypothetical protein
MSIEFPSFLLRCDGGERQVASVAHHNLLAFSTQQVAEKLIHLWIDGHSGRAIDDCGDHSCERVGLVDQGLLCYRIEGARGQDADGEWLDLGAGVTDV